MGFSFGCSTFGSYFFLNIFFASLALRSRFLITTTILGLSAQLNDQDEFSTSFKVVSKDDFQIVINGEKYNDQVVFAGTTLPINPTITHIGDAYPAFVFAEIELDDSTFQLDDNGISSDWKPLDGTDNVWYYGTDEGLVPFTSSDSSTLFESVIVRDDAASTDAEIAITVYAIQTIDHDPTSPTAVWGDAR